MYHKRFLKHLLVVLALALWASTAYGQVTGTTFTTSALSPTGLTYVLGAGDGQSGSVATFTVTDQNAGPDSFTLSPTTGLTATCTGGSGGVYSATSSVPANCTLSVTSAGAATLGGVGSYSGGFSVVNNPTVSTDLTVSSVSVAISLPTWTSSIAAQTLTTWNLGTSTDLQTNLKPTSSVGGEAWNASVTNAGSHSWLTVTGSGTAQTDNSGTTLVLTVNHAAANALTIAGDTAQVIVTMQGVALSFNVTLPVSLPTITIATTDTLSNYQVGGSDSSPTIAITASVAGVTYAPAANCLSGTAWLTVPGTGVANTSGTTLALTVHHVLANALPPSATANTCTVTFTVAGNAEAAQLVVTLPVEAAAVTLSAASFTPNPLTYQIYSDISTPPSATSAITNTLADTSTSYTANKSSNTTLCPAWLTLQTGSLTSGANFTVTVNEALADGATAGTNSCPITLAYTDTVNNASNNAQVIVDLAWTLTAGAQVTLGTVNLTYTVHNGGTITQAVTPISTTINGIVYTATSNQPWLTLTDTAPLTANTAATGSPITLSVLSATADKLSLTHNANLAVITLTPTSGSPLAATTVNVYLNLTAGANTLAAMPTAVTFQHVTGGPDAMTQTVSLIDNLIADTSYGISGGPAWLTVTSANGGATVSGTGTGTLVSGVDQLTFSALYSAVIPAPTVGTPTAVTVTLTAPNEFPLLVTVKFYLVNASTLSTNPTSTSFATSYAKSTIAVPGVPPTAVSITVSNSNGSVQNYSVSTPTPSWLTCTPTNGTAGNSITDQLSCSVNTSSADTTPAGPQTATVHLSTNNGADTTFTITLTITTTVSPLSSTAFPITLNYLVGGPANQASLTGVPATILSSNTVYEPYTANSPTLPTWLTVTPASSRADIAHSDTALFQVVPKYVPAGSGTTKFTVHLAIIGNPSEPDLTVVVTLNVTVSQLTATQPAPLTYVKGTGGTNALYTSVTLTTATGTVSFTVDPATLPLWLTATTAQGGSTPYGTGSANSGAGATVYFNVVTQTAATMATGNYTQNIGFSTAGYADLLVPVTLLISNGAATLGLQETSTLSSIVWGLGTPVPIPTWTPYSSDEPIPFSASCSVVASDTHWVPSAAWAALGNYSPCSLNAAAAVTAKLQVSQTVTGVAFTTGYPIVASLDPGLFASTLGNTVSVTVQVLQTSGGTGSISKTYTYSLQPVNPTITSVSPASAAPIASSTSLVVLVTGTNFVGQQNIKPSSNLAPTLVFLGTSPTALTSGVVVINTTQLQITIPQTSFPGIPSGQTSTKLTIGIANQTGTLPPSQATATGYLTVTTAPVIYGITSTATYVQPTLGSNPSFAPYELISIFGDNFGLINLTPNFLNAAPNSYNLFPTALTLSGTAAAKNLVQLTVTFTPVTGKGTFTAPILFANQNQINAIVPSGVVIGSTVTPSTYNVTVTSGAATNVSTVFPINVLPADPGIFTLASDGSGQGAIINLIDGTINKTGNEATAGQYVSLYLTGLGAPESAAVDTTGNGVSAPLNCVEINGTKAAPGYIQVVDTAVKASSTTTAYVPPTPSWTTIDGAVITYGNNTIISGLPPCMTDTITVTFGTGGTAVTATTLPAGGVTYAGFVSGSVAGLYQINVQIPSGISGLPGSIPVTVTIPPYTSPLATATIALK